MIIGDERAEGFGSYEKVETHESKDRILWVDYAKAVGMLAIVLGHVLRGEGVLSHAVYVFHVPLFFFLSGYVYRLKPGWATVMKNRCMKLLIPYVIFGFASICAYEIFGAYAGAILDSSQSYTFGENVVWMIYGYPFSNSPLWFLPCLFLIEAMLDLCAKCWMTAEAGRQKTLVALSPVLISALITAVHQFLFGGMWPWCFQTAWCVLPFAWMGYLLKMRGVNAASEHLGFRAFSGCALFAVGLILGIFLNDKVQYITLDCGNLLVFYAAASFAISGLCQMLSCLRRCSVLESVGRNTMPILLMHKFPVLVFQCAVPGVKKWLASGSIFWALVVTVVSTALCIGVGRVFERFFPEAIGRSRRKKEIAA